MTTLISEVQVLEKFINKNNGCAVDRAMAKLALASLAQKTDPTIKEAFIDLLDNASLFNHPTDACWVELENRVLVAIAKM